MGDLSIRKISWSKARILAAALTALALGVAEARADHTFTLSGVTFSDGGVATGTFTANDALDTLLGYDVTTSGGSLVGFNYTSGNTVSFSSLPFILVLETASIDHLIQLTFTGLTAAGAPITIGQFDSFEQDPSGTHREVVAGSVVSATAIPEPSSLAMTGVVALAGVVLWARRRSATRR